MDRLLILISGWRFSGKSTTARLIAQYLDSLGFKNYRVDSFANKLKKETAARYNIDLQWFYDEKKKDKALTHLPYYISPNDTWAARMFADIYEDLSPALDYKVESLDNLTFYKQFHSQGKNKDYQFYQDTEHQMFLRLDANTYVPVYHTPRSLLIIVGGTERSINPDIWADHVYNDFLNSSMSILIVDDWRYENEYACACRRFKANRIYTVRIDRFDAHPTGSTACSERNLDYFSFHSRFENKPGYENGYYSNISEWIKTQPTLQQEIQKGKN